MKRCALPIAFSSPRTRQHVISTIWSAPETLSHSYLRRWGSLQVRVLKRPPSDRRVWGGAERANMLTAVKPVTQGKVKKCVFVKRVLKIKKKTSPWSFSSFHSQATEINLFYANLFFFYLFFLHFHSFAFSLLCFIHLPRGILCYRLLVSHSSSLFVLRIPNVQRWSNKKCKKWNRKTITCTTDGGCFFRVVFPFFFNTALPKRRSWSCPCMKTMMEECLLVILGNFYTLLIVWLTITAMQPV